MRHRDAPDSPRKVIVHGPSYCKVRICRPLHAHGARTETQHEGRSFGVGRHSHALHSRSPRQRYHPQRRSGDLERYLVQRTRFGTAGTHEHSIMSRVPRGRDGRGPCGSNSRLRRRLRRRRIRRGAGASRLLVCVVFVGCCCGRGSLRKLRRRGCGGLHCSQARALKREAAPNRSQLRQGKRVARVQRTIVGRGRYF
jgi:hypothetical protein